MAHFYCEICHAAFMPRIMKSFDWTTSICCSCFLCLYLCPCVWLLSYLISAWNSKPSGQGALVRHGAAPPAVKGAADETKPMRNQEGADWLQVQPKRRRSSSGGSCRWKWRLSNDTMQSHGGDTETEGGSVKRRGGGAAGVATPVDSSQTADT